MTLNQLQVYNIRFIVVRTGRRSPQGVQVASVPALLQGFYSCDEDLEDLPLSHFTVGSTGR